MNWLSTIGNITTAVLTIGAAVTPILPEKWKATSVAVLAGIQAIVGLFTKKATDTTKT